MKIDRATAQAFAQAINRIRPDWDVPGIRAVIERSPRNAALSEILVAAVRLAERPDVRSPGLLLEDGPWWDTAATGNTRPAWVGQRDLCPDHGQPRTDCLDCRRETGPELTPEQIRANAAALRTQIAQAGRERVARLAAQRKAQIGDLT